MGDMTETVNKAELNLADLLSTPKRRKFVIAYVENGGNGTAAAEVAGLGAPAQAASRMLKDVKVQEAIARHTSIVANVAGESRDTVINRILNRANCDPRDFFKLVTVTRGSGDSEREVEIEELMRITDLTREQAMCVKKFSWTAHGPSIEFYDASAADRDLARLMGLEPREDANLSPDDAAQLIAAALDRMDELDVTGSPPN